MGKINHGRVIAGAIAAGIFYFIANGFIHGAVLGREHMAAITGAGKAVQHDPTSYVYFAAFDLGKGLVAVLLYAAARPRFGPGVKTAIWAGLVAWFAIEALPQNLKWIALEIVPMAVGAILGAWIYREPAAAS